MSSATRSSAVTTYDEVPYPSSSFPQSHPDKLCAMARLFGLGAPEPSRARVLEIGCADGANLLPMAMQYPEAHFVGIDASATQITVGNAAIAGSGMSNVSLRHQNILEVTAAEGKFDYIIAHGILSWVPEEVRQKIFSICRENLSDNGVAYISYNAFPGWGMRMALRDMMLFHTRSLKDAQAKVRQARALINFLAEAVPTRESPYAMLLRQELERMKAQTDSYLLHDILEEINQPFYFHQFIARATQAGLQYLSEPSFDQMLAANFPDKVQETLAKIGSNIIAREQYMDFVRNRNFRQTLLCHREVDLQRNVSSGAMKNYSFVARFEREGALDLKVGITQVFKVKGTGLFTKSDNPLLKAAFEVLARHASRRVAFKDLLDEAQKLCSSSGDTTSVPPQEAERTLSHNLLRLYARGIADIFVATVNAALVAPKRPQATALARYQALKSRVVTTLSHQSANLDATNRYLLAGCDGTRDAEALVDWLLDFVRQGRLKISENKEAVYDEARLRVILDAQVQQMLPRLTEAGFFLDQ